MFHPTVAYRNCEHCLKYIYDEKTGKPRERHGEYFERLPTVPAPCRRGGCPKGTPENPKVLSPKNMQAYQHWKECKAVGQFPDDEIVKRNAAMIQEIHDQSKELKQIQMLGLMMTGKMI
ncbi:hypothetical protein [Gimesia aquarii]|uniref:Uncharacterized protein n=1 Tax=Gimesia aquarii TaxID=2527964 RepID=A0A517WNJ3_9PLAN|nr:hypothetical protein [Gimesia aquarii]QDU06832.1 hypothetical protein V202x_01750 [Gimesia aquarii]